jgi:hypothetical protein
MNLSNNTGSFKSFNESELLKDLVINETTLEYKIDNNEVNIVITGSDDSGLDLQLFYSRLKIGDRPGYARCTLYYMLKYLIENRISGINANTKMSISTIAPSFPRRTPSTIKKTYGNMGFTSIKSEVIPAMSEKDFNKLVETDPVFSDSKEILCSDSEICSANPEPIKNIIQKLKFCNPNNIDRVYDDIYLLADVDEDIERPSKRTKSGGKYKKKYTQKRKTKKNITIKRKTKKKYNNKKKNKKK